MKKIPQIIAKHMQVIPEVMGRDCHGNYIMRFTTCNIVTIKNVEDRDLVEWISNGDVFIRVNGEVAEDMTLPFLKPKQKPSNKKFGIDWDKDIIVDKEGKLKYTDSKKELFENN